MIALLLSFLAVTVPATEPAQRASNLYCHFSNFTADNRYLIAGDYWHVAASPDGKKLAADDMAGNLWLFETETGNRKLLVKGLRSSNPVHAHASFCRQGRYIVFNDGRAGQGVSVIDLHSLK